MSQLLLLRRGSASILGNAAAATTTFTNSQMLCRNKHTVRVILRPIDTLETPPPVSLPPPGSVMRVAAGYARNYLIPKKMAIYATRENFAKLQMQDPDAESVAQRRQRLTREARLEADEHGQAAERLHKYLRTKTVRIKRTQGHYKRVRIHSILSVRCGRIP
jgi:hypothetical protein